MRVRVKQVCTTLCGYIGTLRRPLMVWDTDCVSVSVPIMWVGTTHPVPVSGTCHCILCAFLSLKPCLGARVIAELFMCPISMPIIFLSSSHSLFHLEPSEGSDVSGTREFLQDYRDLLTGCGGTHVIPTIWETDWDDHLSSGIWHQPWHMGNQLLAFASSGQRCINSPSNKL